LDLSKQRQTKLTKRDVVFQPEFRDDLEYWMKTDRKTAWRAFRFIEEVMRNPFQGFGKPEPLRYLSPGTWSRRLTQEHRIIYLVGFGRIDAEMNLPVIRSRFWSSCCRDGSRQRLLDISGFTKFITGRGRFYREIFRIWSKTYHSLFC